VKEPAGALAFYLKVSSNDGTNRVVALELKSPTGTNSLQAKNVLWVHFLNTRPSVSLDFFVSQQHHRAQSILCRIKKKRKY
jgi:hypothetical protein